MGETVEKLKVQQWEKEERFGELVIQEFIDDRSFIVRAKVHREAGSTWKVFSTIKVENISSQNIMDFGLFYYNFNKIKQNYQLIPHFIYADQCSIKYQNDKKSKGTFIIESQPFQDDIVSLR